MNLTYKLLFGPTLYVRSDHQSWLVTASKTPTRKEWLPKIDKIPTTYSEGDFYLQVAMQLQKELASNMRPVGYVNGLSRLVGVLHLRLCPFVASRYF